VVGLVRRRHGEKLGVVESLVRDGISPIPVEAGVSAMLDLLSDPATPTTVVVMGRAAGLDTVRFEEPILPLARFLDNVLVHYRASSWSRRSNSRPAATCISPTTSSTATCCSRPCSAWRR